MVRCLDTKVLAIVSGKNKPEHASHEGQVHRCTLCTEDPLAEQLAPQKVSDQRGRGSEDGKDCHASVILVSLKTAYFVLVGEAFDAGK